MKPEEIRQPSRENKEAAIQLMLQIIDAIEAMYAGLNAED